MHILVVIFLRLILPLSIFRFPLLGGILAMALDYVDFEIYRELNHGNLDYYQDIDKFLDMYYLGIEAYIVYRFKNLLVRNTALFLYVFRFLGFILFIFTQNPIILVLFPNVFEFFYLTYLTLRKIFKREVITSLGTLIPILVCLTLLKLAHEYFIHINTTYPWTENEYFKRIFDIISGYVTQARY